MNTPTPTATAKTADRIDWSQFWFPGPRRVFTAEEMARAGDDRPGPTLVAVALFNYALLAFALLLQAPAAGTAGLTALLAATGVIGAVGARRLWQAPTRRGLSRWTVGATLVLVGLTLVTAQLQAVPRGDPLRGWLVAIGLGAALLLTSAWWFLTVYRAHQIEARLREQAEQARALEMARQLAAAQIQPHFLFNSLASLQHWVHTQDPRAAPMLDSLTGFLRATLPLFNRPQLALGEELHAVRRYLEVMQARLGERLRFGIDLPDALLPLALPPGLLLTLVENAVEHGVQPCLGGASVQVRGRLQGEQAIVEVADTGAGLAPGQGEGVGLANSRARLAQAWGKAATLELHQPPGGGCIATVTLPRRALNDFPASS